MIGDNKKPDGSEVLTQNQLEKTYEKTLATGSIVKVHITATVSGYKLEDTAEIITKAAECFRNFYWELGKQLNEKRNARNEISKT